MKHWDSADDLFEKWIDNNPDKYLSFELDIQKVQPQKIIALSRTLDENKMRDLRKKVMESGWQNIQPGTISLVKFPDGTYAVNAGGNHRVWLSNELNIKEIEAQVTAIVNKELLSQSDLDKISQYERNMGALQEKINKEKKARMKLKLLDELNNLEIEMRSYMQTIYRKLNLE